MLKRSPSFHDSIKYLIKIGNQGMLVYELGMYLIVCVERNVLLQIADHEEEFTKEYFNVEKGLISDYGQME